MRTQAPKGPSKTTAVVSGGVGPVHRNPALDLCEVPDAVFQHTEGKEGLRRGARAGGGEGLTPCSLSWPIWRFPSDQQAQGNGQEVSGRAEPSFPWPHSQELGSCGPFSLSGGPVRGQEAGPWQPGLLCWRNTHLGAQEPPGVQGPLRRAPLTVGVGSQGRGVPGLQSPRLAPQGPGDGAPPCPSHHRGHCLGSQKGAERGRMGPSLDSGRGLPASRHQV